MKLDHLFTPNTRINSKWFKDLNVRPQTIKILEENLGSKISDTAFSNISSDISPHTRETKEKNKQMGLSQTKKVLHSKGCDQQNKKTTHRMGDIFSDTSDKGLISKTYRQLTIFNTKNNNNYIKNEQRT